MRTLRNMSVQEMVVAVWSAIVPALLGGCATAKAPETGFLRDYSRLKKVDEGRLRYIAPKLKDYSRFMVDPVEMRAKKDDLKPEQRAEVARYMREALEKLLQKSDFQVVSHPDVGVGRVRIAITEVNDTKWYLNLHPASKATGAGMGGAAMEGEIVDSVTGEQVAAIVQVKHASQFRLNSFSTVSDVKNVIDQWVETACGRLKEIRAAR